MTVEETLSVLDAVTEPVCVAQAAAGHIRRLQGELSDMRGDRNRCVELNALHAKRIAELTAELESAAAWTEAHPANAPEPERKATISLGPGGMRIEANCSCGFAHGCCDDPDCMFLFGHTHYRDERQWPCKRCETGGAPSADRCYYHPAGAHD